MWCARHVDRLLQENTLWKRRTLKEGDELSLNGFVGNVYKGNIKSSPSQVIQGLIENKVAQAFYTYKKFMELMSWTDKLRTLGVRTNSDTPEQVQQAIKFGAEGIGLPVRHVLRGQPH